MYSHYPQAAATTVVSTEGRVWNGSSWGVVPPSTSSTVETSATLVQRYTEYYHAYQALVQQSQAQADRYVAPSQAVQREEWLRHVTWYKYYADESSRAAHFYYQNPNTSTPPFELPPPPPKLHDHTNNSISATSPYVSSSTPSSSISSQQQQQPPAVATLVAPASSVTPSTTPSTSNPSSSPDGLKRFYHDCLQTCTSEQERKEVQGKLEQVITKAIQEGTLHTMNWDAMERIRPSTAAVAASVTPAKIVVDSSFTGTASKRLWQETEYTAQTKENSTLLYSAGSNTPAANDSPAAVTSYPHKNKRTRFQDAAAASVEANTTLGNHDYARCGTTLTTLTEFTRVTPPLMEETSSFVNFNESPSRNYDKQLLPANDSYYGPKRWPPRNQDQMDNFSYYGGSVSGSSEEEFVSVPKFWKKANGGIKAKGGFQRSHSKLTKRANRFGETNTTTTAAAAATTEFDKYMGKGMIGGSNKKLDEADFEMMTVKGTCTTLEKEYLRLTAPPRAELVRPQNVLEQHFGNLVSEWKSTSRRRDYLWFCSQFKAIRQDCRVQRILNAFTVRVYETHARMALESDDLNEFNQCQTQLMELYDLILSPEQSRKEQDAVLEHRNEFVAYRFIYYVFLTGNHKGSSSSSELMTLMLSLTPEQWKDPAIAHASQVREAVASMDYHSFFRLGKKCPHLGAYLMDRVVPLIRFKALQRICKSYRPSVELSFVLSELGFNQDEDGKTWLESCGCVVKDDMILTKDSVVRESNLQVKRSLI